MAICICWVALYWERSLESDETAAERNPILTSSASGLDMISAYVLTLVSNSLRNSGREVASEIHILVSSKIRAVPALRDASEFF